MLALLEVLAVALRLLLFEHEMTAKASATSPLET
jgi:hypothetical protein